MQGARRGLGAKAAGRAGSSLRSPISFRAWFGLEGHREPVKVLEQRAVRGWTGACGRWMWPSMGELLLSSSLSTLLRARPGRVPRGPGCCVDHCGSGLRGSAEVSHFNGQLNLIVRS